ncbi:MAG: hypothetical protein NT039_02955 [Candidatus Berkelbacteria bacterium]|nr:hypothetical protein [Candidatus Berkelbacteria bacterium]
MPLKHLVFLALTVAIATLSVVVSYSTHSVVPSFLVGVVGYLAAIFTFFMGIKRTTQLLGLYVIVPTLAAMIFTMPLLWPLFHHP